MVFVSPNSSKFSPAKILLYMALQCEVSAIGEHATLLLLQLLADINVADADVTGYDVTSYDVTGYNVIGYDVAGCRRR